MEKLVNNLLNCVKVEMQTQIEARMRRKITKLLLCSRSWKILYILQKAKMGSISPTPKPRRIATQILLKQEVGRNSCKMCEKNVFKLIYVKANWREFQIRKLLKLVKKGNKSNRVILTLTANFLHYFEMPKGLISPDAY